MNTKYKQMINELILYYWIGKNPSKKVDCFIDNYMNETKQTPELLVENVLEKRKIDKDDIEYSGEK